MSKIKEITLSIEVPIQIAPYHIIKIQSTVTMEVVEDSKEEVQDAVKRAKDTLLQTISFTANEKGLDKITSIQKEVQDICVKMLGDKGYKK